MKSGILSNVNNIIIVTKGQCRKWEQKNTNPEEGIESIIVHMSWISMHDTQP